MAALLWPRHLGGPFDGIPLDRIPEAVLLGLGAPVLWWLQPSYLRSRVVHLLVVTLLLANVGSSFLAREGWCVQFDTPKPLVSDLRGRIRSWDVRADWLSDTPRCSALATRPYREFKEFPAWFFNLPPADNNLPAPEDRPPYATVEMTMSGYLHPDSSGELIIETGETMQSMLVIDGKAVNAVAPSRYQAALDRGQHFIQLTSHLTGNRWALVPLWNGHPIGSSGFADATTSIPSAVDRRVRGPLAMLIQVLAAGIVAGWIATFVWCWRDPVTLGFSLAASLTLGWLGTPGPGFVITPWANWAVSGLGLAILLVVPKSRQTLKGAFVVIGVPWLVFVTVVHASHIGRFSLYAGGDDMWMFQRFAYRIYMQGYWLQGGEATFWFQPFYRWLAGALHLAYGDSSMGEFWWDAISLLASALFAHLVVAAAYGFRWGLAAAALSLTIVMQGPAFMLLGVGLSDTASAGFIYVAALVIASARLRGEVKLSTAIGAGVLAALGFLTRLNNLPIAGATAVFALSLTVPSWEWWRVRAWRHQVSWNAVTGVVAVIGAALLLFSWRTYHYTGVFSFLHGTTWGNHALWQPGRPASENILAMASSLMMVLTFNDPPRFAWYAAPLLFAGAVTVAALAGIGIFRDVPLALVAFFVATCSGALAARGVAYAGRFSIHMVGVCCALTACAIAEITRRFGSSRSSDRARE